MPARHIVLYGSYAKGTAGSDSDIDIAVIVDKVEGDYLDQQAKLYRLRRSVDLRIEPVLIEYGQDKSGFLGRSWIQDTCSIPRQSSDMQIVTEACERKPRDSSWGRSAPVAGPPVDQLIGDTLSHATRAAWPESRCPALRYPHESDRGGADHVGEQPRLDQQERGSPESYPLEQGEPAGQPPF